ncbi:hypothetical protein [Aquimarina celericrescens]|uniref:Lipoprotein n=1 Tax=Aquimarina celericrescens TaxID=1964542 RepID=A0ABW5B4I4_9FLAO|nr:hypothetical protein [Aquimarina celericrescens]
MKKFVLIILSITIISCSKDEVSESLVSSDQKIEEFTYHYEGNIYKLKIDFSNKEQPKVLEESDNKRLKEIFELPNVVFVLNNGDSNNFYLFRNVKEYKKTNLYRESIKALKKTENSLTKDYVPNGVTFWRDLDFTGPSQTFSNSVSNLHLYTMPNDGRIWGDNITSIKLSGFANLELFIDINYSGRSLFLNSFGRASEWRNLKNNTWNDGFWPFTREYNWNDEVSSFKLYRR